MKKFKNLIILTLCFTFMITTADVHTHYTSYEIIPLDHHHTEVEKK